MINLERVTKLQDYPLNELFNLYIESFPPQERRDIDQLKHLIENQSNMHFNAIIESDELCGLFIYWDFDTFIYIEHFAIFPEKRNRKIGEKVLSFIALNQPKYCILEAEPALDEISTRRVNYYKRNGYEILDKEYIQPSYSSDPSDDMPLWIMGYPKTIQPELLNEYIKTIKKEVYSYKE